MFTEQSAENRTKEQRRPLQKGAAFFVATTRSALNGTGVFVAKTSDFTPPRPKKIASVEMFLYELSRILNSIAWLKSNRMISIPRVPVFLLLSLLAAANMSSSLAAKPLLTDSQSTYASACIAGNDAQTRLIEICQRGLEDIGASDRQRITMLENLAWSYIGIDDLDQAEKSFGEILVIDP
ncbi:hypothetical protein [Ruegeria jejuensis]|uniref:hypothetical protein n=1 Tax=Ruegeria jejuensis TaxID=3233338 RepID=UPI00355B8AB2